MSSLAYDYGTVAGNMYNQGISNLVDLGNKYKDNPTIGGMVAGSLADTYRTQANTGQALAYNNAFLGSLANYQQGMENLKTGNTMKLMSAEGQIAGNLMDKQGGWQIKGIQEKGNQERMSLGVAGQEQRKGMVVKGEQDRLGIKESGAQQRLGIQTAGQQERLNIAERTTQELRGRSDARGSIRSAGRRFFG